MAPYYAQLHEYLKSDLGEDVYNAAYEREKSLDLNTVIEDILAEFGESNQDG